MPVQNELKVTRTTRVSRRMADDMELRNDLLLNQDVVTEISRYVSPVSPYFIFSGGFLGGGKSADSEILNPEMKGAGQEFIVVRKIQETCIPGRVVDNRLVPDKLIVQKGISYDVTLDKFVGEQGTKVILRDEKTVLMVSGVRASADGRYDYSFQLTGTPGSTAPGSLLSIDSIVQYGMGNSQGEGSLTGNTFVTDGERQTDTINAMQITRNLLVRTGSAVADDLFKFDVVITKDGVQENKSYYVDLPVKAAKKHFMGVNYDLMYSQPNFDFTRIIQNRMNTSRYPERPTYAGYYWWMDRCPWQWPAYQSASDAEGVYLLESILEHQSELAGGRVDLVAFASGIGRQWLKRILMKAMQMKNYQIQIMDPTDKISVGFEVDEYYTANGSIKIVDMWPAFKEWNQYFDRVHFNGVSYNARSRYIYLTPMIIPNTDGGMKQPSSLYYKSANGIDRAFVMGVSRGMTGQTTGISAEKMGAMSDEGIRRMMNNEKYRLDSTFDGEEIHFLSHLSPYIDCSHMSRITLF